MRTAYAPRGARRPHGVLTAHLPESSKDSKENGGGSRSVTPIPSRSVTPKPPDGAENNFRSGTLTIRIFSGEHSSPYALPTPVPESGGDPRARHPVHAYYSR